MARASFKLQVLIWADLFAMYVMWMLMVYLTDVWKLDYTKAAAIINVWMGLQLVLPVVFAHIPDAFLGNFGILLITTLSYVLGLGLLFYTGLSLMAIGVAGHKTSYVPFVNEQSEGDTEETLVEDVNSLTGLGFASLAGILVVIFVKPWATQFGICALLALLATLIFLTGARSYKYKRPLGSPMTTNFRVFVASLTKMIYRTTNMHELHNPGSGDLYEPLTHTQGLRCFDKAAIVLPNQSVEQQEQNRWRLCSVTEVEETKIIIRMIPMWVTFILCGVVSSIGNTYFLEQARDLNPKLGHLKVPLIFFFWVYNQGKNFYSKLYFAFKMVFRHPQAHLLRRTLVPPFGVAIAMVFSILCCITAAKVETRRLGVLQSHN